MTEDDLFKRHEIVAEGIDGLVIDYDAFDANHLSGLDDVDAKSLTGRALGHYYVKRLIRYLKNVDKLPADKHGALFMVGISQGAGVPYQNMFRPGKLKNMIELARKRKGLRRWADTIDPKIINDDAGAEKDQEIRRLRERLVTKDAELRDAQAALKAEQEAHRETRRVMQDRIHQLEEQRAGGVEEMFSGHWAR